MESRQLESLQYATVNNNIEEAQLLPSDNNVNQESNTVEQNSVANKAKGKGRMREMVVVYIRSLYLMLIDQIS